jgi:hypothetical protein
MKLILKEAQERILHKYILNEYAGYVNGWSNLIQYIYNHTNKLFNSIRNSYNNQLDDEIVSILRKSYEDTYDDAFPPLVIKENTLNKLGIYNLMTLTIHYIIYSGLDGAAFDKDSITRINNKYNNAEIYISVPNLIVRENELKVSLQHELTHLYQLLKMYKQNGIEHTNNTFQNKFYNSNLEKNNIPNIFSYAFSKIELNAYISELYTELTEKQADMNNYKEIVSNSKIYDLLNLLIKIKNAFSGKNWEKYTTQVINWIDNNPEHIDMFPSNNGMSLQRYNKRLIMMMNDKIKYINAKINKLVERYLMNIKKEQ